MKNQPISVVFISDDCGKAMFVNGKRLIYTDADYTEDFVSALLGHLGFKGSSIDNFDYSDENGTLPSDENLKGS